MLVKELIEELKDANPDAKVLICYEHDRVNYFTEPDSVESNTRLIEDENGNTKLVMENDKILIWTK